jgi:hypothetical protein
MKIRATGAPTSRERFDGETVKLTTFIPFKIKKRGVRRVILQPEQGDAAQGNKTSNLDAPLLVALSRAFYWQRLLDEGRVASGTEIARLEGLHHSTVNELLRLTLLDPGIIQDILTGQQPRCMSLLWFQRNPLPVDWQVQRALIAQFDA